MLNNSLNSIEIFSSGNNLQRIVFTVYILLVSVAGVIGNIIVVLFCLFKCELKPYLRLLMENLGVINVLVLLLCLPKAMQDTFLSDKWTYAGELTCSAYYYLETCLNTISSATLVLLCLDRAMANFNSSKANELAIRRMPKLAMTFVWLASIILTLPMIKIATYERRDNLNGQYSIAVNQCSLDASKMHASFLVAYVILIYLLPTVGLVVLVIPIACMRNIAAKKTTPKKTEEPIPRSPSIYRARTYSMHRASTHQSYTTKQTSLKVSQPNDNVIDADLNHSRRYTCVAKRESFFEKKTKHDQSMTWLVLTVAIAFYTCQLPTRLFTLWSLKNDAWHIGSLNTLTKQMETTVSPTIITLVHLARAMFFSYGILNTVLHAIMSKPFRQN